jgi:hypothetical protein
MNIQYQTRIVSKGHASCYGIRKARAAERMKARLARRMAHAGFWERALILRVIRNRAARFTKRRCPSGAVYAMRRLLSAN